MSPTIPSVLVLSLLLLQSPAEAEKMMNPFALIRKTLKYWRNVYNMYQEEVTLGYCWAEYLLELKESTKDEPISRLVSHDPLNTKSAMAGDRMKQMIDNTFLKDREKMLLLSEDSPREHVRQKRSHGTLNSTDTNIGNFAERNTDNRRWHSTQKSETLTKRNLNDGNINTVYELGTNDIREHRFHDFVRGRDCNLSSVERVEKTLFSFLSSLNEPGAQQNRYSVHLLCQRGKKVAKHVFDIQFKENQAEGDQEFSGKSKGDEADTRRRVLYSKMRHITSGGFPRRAFLLEIPCHECQKLLDARLYRNKRITSVNTLQFIVSDRTKNRESNRGKRHICRRRKFALSNSKLKRVNQPLNTFRNKYQRKLRYKRDTNQMINRSNWYLTKYPKLAPYTSTPTDTYVKFSFSSSQAGHGNSVNAKIERKKQRTEVSSRIHNLMEVEPYPSSFYPKSYGNIHRVNERSYPVSSNPSFFIRNSWVIPASLNYVLPKGLPRVRPEKRENNWELWDTSKQLLTGNRNRYQRTEHFLHSKKSTLEESGKKVPTRYPTGQPSSLSVSYQRFMGDYENSTSGTSQVSRLSRSSSSKDQGRFSYRIVDARGFGGSLTALFNNHTAFMPLLRALGFFVQVGKEVMDYVESNAALACTKDYLWGKVIKWIES